MITDINNVESVVAYGGVGLVKNEIEQLMEMQKAFLAGADINIADLTGGQAGRVQNLESTFKLITYKESAAAFWRDVPKDAVDSTVLEWARINEVAGLITYSEAGAGDSDFVEQDDDMDRQYDTVKFMGVRGSVSFVAKDVKMLQAAEALETQNKIRSFVRGLDLLCWFGDNSLNSYEFNGLFKQHALKCTNPSQNVFDLRGKRLSDSKVNEACTVIADNYGNPNGLQIWMSNKAAEGWVQDKIANKSYITNFAGGLDQPQVKKNFELENGMGVVKKDVFLRSQNVLTNRCLNKAKTAFVSNHPKAPSIPANNAPSVVPSTTSYSMDAGDYDYAITAFNRFGEGEAREFTVSVVGTGNMVQFTLAETTPVAGQLATGYKIYRRAGAETDIKKYELVKTVGTGTQYDDGEYIPGTSQVALIDWDSDQVIRFAQLLPMYKLYYGIRGDKLEWLHKLYGTLQIYNANKIVIFKNVGVLPN